MGSFPLGQISRPSQIRTVLYGTTVSFVSVVLCFLILEVGYRVYRMQKYGIVEMADLKGHQAFVADPLYGSRPIRNFDTTVIDPKVRRSAKPLAFWLEKDVHFNSLGYRGKEFTVPKDHGIYRIVMLGGSTVQNLEVDDGDTWSARLEDKLNHDPGFLAARHVSRAEVINAGVSGWRSREGLLLLQREIIHFSPDCIMIAFNWNDAWHGVNMVDPNGSMYTPQPVWQHSLLLQNLHTRFLNMVVNNTNTIRAFSARLSRDSEWAQVYRKNLAEMIRITEAAGAKAVLINLPGLARQKDTTSVEARSAMARAGLTADNYLFYAEMKSLISEMLHDIGRQHNVPVIDVHRYYESFHDAELLSLFVDVAHTTREGSGHIAEAIYFERTAY